MCKILKDVYRKIYGKSFNYNNSENRIKLQKMVYLIEIIGLHVGDYSFSWDKYGPYSIRLNEDAFYCNDLEENADIVFSEEAIRVFENIKNMLSMKDEQYTEREWMNLHSHAMP